MATIFHAAKIANGLTGIANTLAYGNQSRENRTTLRSAGESVANLGSALLNALNPNSYMSGGSLNGSSLYNSRSLPQGSPTEWLNQHIRKSWGNNGIIRYMYSNLFQKIMPDISGYTLLFMVPPDLSGYRMTGNQNYDYEGSSFVSDTLNLTPLLAVNFTPPTIQLNTSTISGSAGTQHFATKLNITDTMSVSFIETINLDIYSFHSSWLKYIFQVLEGTLEPDPDYITKRKIDYAASFYFVKFLPNVEEIQYVGKAIGCFPRE